MVLLSRLLRLFSIRKKLCLWGLFLIFMMSVLGDGLRTVSPPHTRLPFSWFSNRQKSPIKIARYKRIKIAAYKEYWFLIFFKFFNFTGSCIWQEQGNSLPKNIQSLQKDADLLKRGQWARWGSSICDSNCGWQAEKKHQVYCFVLFCFPSRVLYSS